jgi:tRNA(His) guanylyltransferase
MSKSDLSYRMKGYEEAARTSFPKRLPLIVRVDGKSFGKLTARLKKPGEPFHPGFTSIMNKVAIALCEEIQGAQVAYVQSDEVSVLIHGYKKFDSGVWFDNQCQKIVSVAASIAAATFTVESWQLSNINEFQKAYFDARAFVIPEHDVTNYFVWRQSDAIRNSINMLGRSHFSHSHCEGKSCSNMLAMLESKNISWDALPDGIKRGRCIVKRKKLYTLPDKTLYRDATTNQIMKNVWKAEDSLVFSQNRDFIENLLAVEEK